ncbi:hypothetical protein [Kibdelosporangium phytohabitans]|uniref:DUF3558 domain-containing protein n=1 Tax=Kibdelosporangium phytohabitans TaxID=860235 RepID=A0A0N9HY71_9PSEU|nr:hypothetical protein [Kibdelosporangium phytohabitans]ALG08262.1 hypothetical protein AOZ06_16285 [Kibdelosporangium phytohabitans]MBE1470725.1 hypothetical protein [Kibdelosporangium phytohabitans]
MRIAAVLVVVAALWGSGCATAVPGTPMAAERISGAPGTGAEPPAGPSPDDYEPMPEHGVFSSEDQNQPMPVPSWAWHGWAGHGGLCAWVPSGMFDGLAAGPPLQGGPACSFVTTSGNNVQITWGMFYSPFLYDKLAFIDVDKVAGLHAMVYDLRRNQDAYPGSCQVRVDTRSLSGVSVLHWNNAKKHLDRKESCAVAMETARRIVTGRVPLAGGTVWGPTQQHPAPAAVPPDACGVVDNIVATFAGLPFKDGEAKRGQNKLGATCVVAKNGREAATILTPGPGQGLRQVPAPESAEVRDTAIGTLPGRTEVAGKTCAVAVELVPGRVLRIQFSRNETLGDECMYARELVMVAVGRLIEKA